MPTGHYPRKGLPERFDEKWRLDDASGCWLWTGAKVKRTDAYEQPIIGTWRSRTETASRIAWMLYRGSIPDNMNVLHRCDNPICVNPEHLFLGTHQDNMDDMRQKRRRFTKLTETDVIEIRRRFLNGDRRTIIAADYGVSPAMIYYIGKRESWGHL